MLPSVLSRHAQREGPMSALKIDRRWMGVINGPRFYRAKETVSRLAHRMSLIIRV